MPAPPPAAVRWLLAVLVTAGVGGSVYAYYRATYNHSKRLREVTAGKLYRSGQLTADGFAEAFHKFGIRTVVNLQEEARDPLIPASYPGKPTLLESDVCARNGVRYVSLDGGVLDAPSPAPGPAAGTPKLLTDFYQVLDDPAAYPVLIHCKAGLHRTGLLAAVYRMEYEGRPKDDVVRELRGNGFGTFAATDGNLYVKKYITDFQPRRQGSAP